jgi:hypothetical protein
MTPPAALVDQDIEYRPSKKQRLDPAVDKVANPDQSATIWSHPLGIRPSGNAFTASTNLKAAVGTFALLPDEILTQFLDYLDAQDLLRLGGTCRALHGFTRSEELWKALFIEYVSEFNFTPLLASLTVPKDHNRKTSTGVAHGDRPSYLNHVLKSLTWIAAISSRMPSIDHISVLTCPWSLL